MTIKGERRFREGAFHLLLLSTTFDVNLKTETRAKKQHKPQKNHAKAWLCPRPRPPDDRRPPPLPPAARLPPSSSGPITSPRVYEGRGAASLYNSSPAPLCLVFPGKACVIYGAGGCGGDREARGSAGLIAEGPSILLRSGVLECFTAEEKCSRSR